MEENKGVRLIDSNGVKYSSYRVLAQKLHTQRGRCANSIAKKGYYTTKSGVTVRLDTDKVNDVKQEEKSVDTLIKERDGQKELGQYKKTIKKLVDEVAMLRLRQGLVDGLSNVVIEPIIAPKEKVNSFEGDNTAVALFSDVHYSNRIEPSVVNYLNEYNPTIAEKRCENFFIRLCELIAEEQCHRTVSTCVLGVLGDILNGWLREEAMQTNYCSPLSEMVKAKAILLRGLLYLEKHLDVKQIKVICTLSNHSRSTAKVQYANAPETNYEYIIFKDIQENAALYGLHKCEIYVPESIIGFLDVYDKRLAFLHGHNTRYYGGIGGIFVPLNKFFANLNNREHVDIMCIAHYHQLFFSKNIIVNGSICGIDHYAYAANLPYEPAQQALFFISEKYGATKKIPIFVE